MIKIREGSSSWGTIRYTVDGNKVRRGESPWGDIVYTVDGHNENRVALGRNYSGARRRCSRGKPNT